jgi:UDP-glucose 4-epimerase
MKILVTGGSGYIGSHTVLCLLNAGYEMVVYDNLCNSSVGAVHRVEQLSGKSVTFVEGDIRDKQTLEQLFSWHAIQAVIHFAALKAVGESTQIPLAYYQNNVHGSLRLLEMMQVHGINDFIFSSSATVYGEKYSPPLC